MSCRRVVLAVVDSLRADHLGCYGYRYPTSPHLDLLAHEALVFDRAFAPGIPTTPAFTTLLSGLHPYRHGVTAHSSEQLLDDSVVLLPQLAQRAGWVTVGIDNLLVQGQGRASWFARGFDYYSGYLYQPFSNQSEKLVNRALRYLRQYEDRPHFLFLHLWDPHSPYGPPEAWRETHYHPATPSDPDEPKMQEVLALAPEYYEHFLGDMKMARPDDYRYVVAQYDGEISYMDSQLGRLLRYLQGSELWDETLLVVMSDHGECFGEGGVYFDHHGLYDAVMRVAMLMHVPGAAPRRIETTISTEDIMPTLARWAGWPSPPADITGHELGEPAGDFREREVIYGVESTRQASLCLRTAGWKYIEPITHDYTGSGLPDIYGRPRSPAPLLYDLMNDPGEKNNCAAAHPEVTARLKQQLAEWRVAEVKRRGGHDPVQDGLSLAYDDFMSRLLARNLRS